MGMLEVDFFWTPAIGYLVENDFNDFGVRIVNPRPASLIKLNVGDGCLRHLSCSPCMNGYIMMLRRTYPTTPWHLANLLSQTLL